MWARARLSCDRCLNWYEIDLDTGSEESLWNNIWDAARGVALDMKDYKRGEFAMFCDVIDGEMCCPKCTHAAGHMSTPRQIEQILEGKQPTGPKLVIDNGKASN